MNEIAPPQPQISSTEFAMMGNDLSKLNPKQRADYVKTVCESLKLNPFTNPLQYITLNGKLTLYATKGASDQLRAIHGISITITEQKREADSYIVRVKAKNAQGREDEDMAIVTLTKEDGEWTENKNTGKKFFKKNGNLIPMQGDELANAMMKCLTKAKRRVTLSICGLGMLDETEVETIKGAKPVDVTEPEPEPQKIEPPKKQTQEESYLVTAGEFKGKRVSDIETDDMINYLARLEEYQKTSTKKPTKLVIEIMFNMEEELKRRNGELK